MIGRQLQDVLIGGSKKGFVNIIYGPRRVGKTFLSEHIIQNLNKHIWLKFNGDTDESRETLSTTSLERLSTIIEGYDAIFIDEAQRIPNIGLTLKILIDNFPDLFILVTGSSSIDISKGVVEPLTGRAQKYTLYPISVKELRNYKSATHIFATLEEILTFGSYPHVLELAAKKEKVEYLNNLVEDYLLRDIKFLVELNSYDNVLKTAQLLAYQVGREVSISEISNALKVDDKTVNRYISLLKKAFIIFEISAYSTNLRKEIVKGKKYYFWDLGIRNALINQFQDFNIRNDKGHLWENFLVMERVKLDSYLQENHNFYFWRTYDGAEVDWIEEKNGEITPFEFKYQKSNAKTPAFFLQNYKKQVQVVNKDNFIKFLS